MLNQPKKKQITIEMKPQRGFQMEAFKSPADIVIGGGQAGSGKTWWLLAEPLRHLNVPNFAGTIFRRSHQHLTLQGGLWDESKQLYPHFGFKPNNSSLRWTRGNSMSIMLDAIQYEDDVKQWQGAQIPYIAFDEATHFSREMILYLISRNRSTCGVRPYMRMTCNPDPDSFIAELVQWWIGEDGYPIDERSGKVRYQYIERDVIYQYDDINIARESHPAMSKIADPLTITFVAGKLDDNKILLEKDPTYKAKLLSLSEVETERLLKGNWKVRPSAGRIVDRAWFHIVDDAPIGGIECRGWDFAATEKRTLKDDPDYTASCKIRQVGGKYFVFDATEAQISPTEIDRRFINTTLQDAEIQRNDVRYLCRFEIEPGSASRREAERLVGMVAGIEAEGIDARGDKVTRARGFAAQAKAGNVYLVRGEWNEKFLRHVHSFPDGKHDDIMDATSLAFNQLANIRSFMGI